MQRQNSKPLSRFALIGCGQMGSLFDEGKDDLGVLTLSHALSSHPSSELVAVCDFNIERAQKCAQMRGNVPAYSKLEEMLAAHKPEGLAIATPPQARYDIIEIALKAGVRIIWCEKPMACNLQEAQKIGALLDQYKDQNIVFAVNYLRRWMVACHKIKSLIESETLGITRAVNLLYGKGVNNNGSHFIDLMHYFYGAAKNPKILSILEDVRAQDPTLNASLEFEQDGVPFSFNLLANDHRNYNLCEMDMIFENGRIKMLNGGGTIEIYKTMPSALAGYSQLKLDETMENATKDILCTTLSQILSVAKGQEPKPLSGFDNALMALETIDQIYQQLPLKVSA